VAKQNLVLSLIYLVYQRLRRVFRCTKNSRLRDGQCLVAEVSQNDVRACVRRSGSHMVGM